MARGINVAACLAEFLAMTLFILIGCGTAVALPGKTQLASDSETLEWSADLDPGWVLHVGLSFGIAIMVLAYSIGHISGGEINCAVTLGLIIAGVQSPLQGAANVVAQLLGSVFGAVILSIMFSAANDNTVAGGVGGLGTNAVGSAFGVFPTLVAEVFGTFLLMMTVLQTAVNPKSKGNRAMACMAIGLSVTLAHLVLIPIDGCSINPTRSFGPAVVALFVRNGGFSTFFVTGGFWVFVVGPCIGSSLASLVYTKLLAVDGGQPVAESESSEDEETLKC